MKRISIIGLITEKDNKKDDKPKEELSMFDEKANKAVETLRKIDKKGDKSKAKSAIKDLPDYIKINITNSVFIKKYGLNKTATAEYHFWKEAGLNDLEAQAVAFVKAGFISPTLTSDEPDEFEKVKEKK